MKHWLALPTVFVLFALIAGGGAVHAEERPSVPSPASPSARTADDRDGGVAYDVESGTTTVLPPATGPVPMQTPALDPSVPPTDAALRDVIGDDQRRRVRNTRLNPHRAIVRLTFNRGGETSACSGFLYAPRMVATAGHCMHDDQDGWSQDVVATPARNGARAPFGTCRARIIYAPREWIEGRGRAFDYGAVRLRCPVGKRTGTFGLLRRPAGWTGTQAAVHGYPGERERTQWGMRGTIRGSVLRELFYDMDTTGGQSGSPVYRPGRKVIAIHANGVFDGVSTNSGPRVTREVLGNLNTWRRG